MDGLEEVVLEGADRFGGGDGAAFLHVGEMDPEREVGTPGGTPGECFTLARVGVARY